MSVIDIRPIKSELRQKYRSLRQTMPPEIKEQKDAAIAALTAGDGTAGDGQLTVACADITTVR